MRRLISCSIFLAFGSVMTGCATPQPSAYIYPARGQTAEQVRRDQAECQAWAKQQTGFDPALDTAKGAGVGAAIGALGGAAAGAAIGAAAGSPGKGAAIGAAAGGLGGAGVGGAMGYTKSKEGYDKAYAACMSARGYAVAGQRAEQPQAAVPTPPPPVASVPPPPPPPQVVAAPPPVIIQTPPQLVVVPGTPVYYAPGVNFNYFAYGGLYYVFHNGAWFYATAYSGPWAYIALEYVPQPVLAVPAQYYNVPPGHWKRPGPPPWAGPKKW